MSFLGSLGVVGIPLFIVLVLMLLQVGRVIGDSMRLGPDRVVPPRIHSVLVLGVLGACLGVLGTLVGVWVTAGVIADAGQVSTRIAWGGIRVALTPSILGFFILGLASCAWLGLQYADGRRGRVGR